MKSRSVLTWVVVCASALPLLAAEDDQQKTVPIYRVTVLERSMQAVNYGHRALPTKIDFRGTVLDPEARGTATVEARAGVVEVDAKFSNLGTPSRFGTQYLTYVLWAISPDGRAQALGELLTNSSDKGKLKVTTPLQTFALMVTAEPYFAVAHPSGVVVMENILRPDTIGSVQQVLANHELMPRESFTLDLNDAKARAGAPAPMVSQKQYEAILEIYQAQNALQIAKSVDADRLAADSYLKAEQLLARARQLQADKADSKTVVMTAREAAQRAEDARAIALKRREQKPPPLAASVSGN